MSRTINFHMDAVAVSVMCQATDARQWQGAVGYLSQWNMTFPVVSIQADGPQALTAAYFREDGNVGYVIGAVWDGSKFGFHS